MMVEVKWNGKMAFTGVSARSQHQVRLDTSAENGGENSGVADGSGADRPCRVFGYGRGEHSGQKRIDFSDLVITVEGSRRSEHPRIFTEIGLTFTFAGTNLEEKRKALEDTVQLSMEKYCSVAGMLNKAARITWQVKIA